MAPNVAQAASILSVRESEIAEVFDSPAGLVIRTTDGVSYIDVPADAPDEDGKTGLMFLAAPKEGSSYAFPIYAQPVGAGGEEEAREAGSAAASGPIDLAKATVPEIAEWVGESPERALQALEAERARPRPRTSLLSRCEAVLEAASEQPAPEGDAPDASAGDVEEPSDGAA